MNTSNTFHGSSASTQSRLQLRSLCVSLQKSDLFGHMNVTIEPGEIVTIMGPSGCGKSSLLAAIAGTLSSDFSVSGGICLGDRDLNKLPPEDRHIGMLFQEDLLFPHMSVGENLKFGIPASIKGKQARDVLATQALEEAGLVGYFDRDPATLSGGQRARVAVLRTLLSRPSALLLDEPFSKLDVELRERFRQFVFRHVKAHHLPTLLVTHDPDDAHSANGPIIEMAAFQK
ncbi:ABC transporter ATP-binding protein [Alphaproteobacteria bacterium 46_93_T64]|nr:ABC transporter ATP-binding protein [Alphaproteobacteria bacterium 46_93_T64]